MMLSLLGWQSCLEGTSGTCKVLLLGGWLHRTALRASQPSTDVRTCLCEKGLETPTPLVVLGT